MPNIPSGGVEFRCVAVTVAVGGNPLEGPLTANIVATAGNDGIGSEEGIEASAAAAELDEAFRRGDSYSQTRSKRRRISPPAPQQQQQQEEEDDAVLSSYAQRYAVCKAEAAVSAHLARDTPADAFVDTAFSAFGTYDPIEDDEEGTCSGGARGADVAFDPQKAPAETKIMAGR